MSRAIEIRNVDTTSGEDVIAPPSHEGNDRPVYPDECRVLGSGLGRSTKLEQMQVETNKEIKFYIVTYYMLLSELFFLE